jgi:hypothetical protein
MSETTKPDTPPVPEIQARLREVAGLLRESPSIDPESRQALAGLIDELSTALGSAPAASAEVTHLGETTAHLVESLHRHEQGPLGQLRDRLERAVLAAEARAPFAAGLVRRMLDALADMGI